MKTFLAIILLSVLGAAQTIVHAPGREVPNQFTSQNQFTLGAQLGPVTVATFPASPAVGQIVAITDGSVPGDCTVGNGTNFNLCGWNGFSWVNPLSSSIGVFTNITTGSLTVNGPGGIITIGCQTAPANPATGSILAYCDSGTGLITYLNSTGGAANPGGAAWSAVTAATNANTGSFIATGNIWDFTGVTIFKMRIGAGLVTTTNGDAGYDTTNKNWHLFGNAVDNLVALLIASGTYTAGHCINIGSINPLTLADSGAGCGGTSAGSSLLFSAYGGNFPTGSTFYLGGGTTPGTTEGTHQISVPRAGTISGLSCRVNNALSASQSYTFTVLKGAASNGAVTGVAQSVTCAINSTNTNGCQDNAHNFAISLNDILEIQVVAANTPVTSPGVCTLLFQ